MIFRNSLLIATLAICTSISVHAQTALIQKTDLKDVTVFTNVAELTHHASFNLPIGSSEVIFTNIANGIDESSIQIVAGPGVNILSVRPASNPIKQDIKTKEYLKAEKIYKEELDKQKKIENQKETEESMLKLLEQNQRIGQTNSGSTVAELAKMVEFYKVNYLNVKNNISELGNKLSEQIAIVEKAKIQFDEVKSQSSGSAGQLVVQLMNDQSGNQPFTISYLTRTATWHASYELRVDDLSSPLQIVYKANVAQKSGIDWKNVNLRLSSSNPTQGGVAPTLRPWHLYYESGNRNAGIILEEVAVASHPIQTKALNNLVQQSENQLNTTFDINIPYSIASNGKMHGVSLRSDNQTAQYHYYVAPRVNSDVFLMAELTDYEKLNLVPGQANVIFENMLAGKTYINPNEATDTLKLSLGRDKMVSVKREKINDLSSSKILGNSRTQTSLYEIHIKNNKKSSINLTLQEQLPISTDRTMDINLLESSGAHLDKDTGIVTWQLNIPAHGIEKLKFGYSVKYPKDKQLNL